jgi:hypothetical protein
MPAKKKIAEPTGSREPVADLMAVGAEAPTPAPAKPLPGTTRVVTDADLAADREFIASLDDTADAVGDGSAVTAESEATEEPEPADGAPTDASVADAAPVRGGVNALVTRLLADPALSYEAIVAAVRAEHPGANTTARSVASTASVLRRKGTPVPMRRGPKD